MDELTENYVNVSEELLQSLYLPRKDINSYYLKFFLPPRDFQWLSINIVQIKREQEGMKNAFIRDISALLSLVSETCEKEINLHLQAERDTLKHILVR